MNIRRARDCLVAATLWALMTFAMNVSAQGQGQGQEQEQQPAQQAPRKLFVSDKLVLNVYAEPDQGSERVATIETGDVVEELERAEHFVRVRLDGGREGWVGANYLTSDEPAATRLRELQREQKGGQQAAEKKAADEIARLKKESAALQAQVSALKSAAASAARAPVDPAPDATTEEAQQEVDPAQMAGMTAADAAGIPWAWALAVVLAAGLGFAGGYQTLAGRIRKKFGGLRIY